MRLEEIGFYTMHDDRALRASTTTPLQRCELVLTTACNFKCGYCRPLCSSVQGTMDRWKAHSIVDRWAQNGLASVRFSGGEPTLVPYLTGLVRAAWHGGISNIAISTNGSADRKLYDELIEAGVNDFSVSLDACCSADGDAFAGGIPGAWSKVVENIMFLSKQTYVTVGVVATNDNLKALPNIIRFADSLGVADIRIISAAQFNHLNPINIDKEVLKKHPILAYRIKNLHRERGVRGLKDSDSKSCPLVLDDMAIAGNYHFPCIITLREGHGAIGTVDSKSMGMIREERKQWMESTCTHSNKICRENCLDVCIDYNNKVKELRNDTD